MGAQDKPQSHPKGLRPATSRQIQFAILSHLERLRPVVSGAGLVPTGGRWVCDRLRPVWVRIMGR